MIIMFQMSLILPKLIVQHDSIWVWSVVLCSVTEHDKCCMLTAVSGGLSRLFSGMYKYWGFIELKFAMLYLGATICDGSNESRSILLIRVLTSCVIHIYLFVHAYKSEIK